MALILIVETGAGLLTSNSYATVAEGDTYHDGHLYATGWTGAILAKKTASLVMSSRVLDDNMDWNGGRASENQALRFPRDGVYDKDGYIIMNNVIPVNLKDATIELARFLLASDRTAEPDTKGIRKVKADTIDIEFDKLDRDKGYVIPFVVSQMIASYGLVIGINQSQARAMRV